MTAASACPICNMTTAASSSSYRTELTLVARFTCHRCGKFEIEAPYISKARELLIPLKARLSSWIRDLNEVGEVPLITTSILDNVEQFPTVSIPERIRRLQKWAAKKQGGLSQWFSLSPDAIAVTHSSDMGEIVTLIQYLVETGDLRRNTAVGNATFQVTLQGFMHAESSSQTGPSSRAFIAMAFNPKMQAAREFGIKPAISKAGFEPIIVDAVEHSGKIDDEIISQIRQSRFLVADFSGHRGGVYFEAGFAMGLGLPVIWTCGSDDFDQLHFDIRQYNCIKWDAPDYLATALQRRIEAVVGRGPLMLA